MCEQQRGWRRGGSGSRWAGAGRWVTLGGPVTGRPVWAASRRGPPAPTARPGSGTHVGAGRSTRGLYSRRSAGLERTGRCRQDRGLGLDPPGTSRRRSPSCWIELPRGPARPAAAAAGEAVSAAACGAAAASHAAEADGDGGGSGAAGGGSSEAEAAAAAAAAAAVGGGVAGNAGMAEVGDAAGGDVAPSGDHAAESASAAAAAAVSDVEAAEAGGVAAAAVDADAAPVGAAPSASGSAAPAGCAGATAGDAAASAAAVAASGAGATRRRSSAAAAGGGPDWSARAVGTRVARPAPADDSAPPARTPRTERARWGSWPGAAPVSAEGAAPAGRGRRTDPAASAAAGGAVSPPPPPPPLMVRGSVYDLVLAVRLPPVICEGGTAAAAAAVAVAVVGDVAADGDVGTVVAAAPADAAVSPAGGNGSYRSEPTHADLRPVVTARSSPATGHRTGSESA